VGSTPCLLYTILCVVFEARVINLCDRDIATHSLQWIRFSLPNCVVCSEHQVFAAELCCLLGISFRRQIMLSIANKVFAAELYSLQWIRCSLPNCVVRKKSVFTVELCVWSESVLLPNCGACSESVFAAEWWCLQRIEFWYQIYVSPTNQFVDDFVFQWSSPLTNLRH